MGCHLFTVQWFAYHDLSELVPLFYFKILLLVGVLVIYEVTMKYKKVNDVTDNNIFLWYS